MGSLVWLHRWTGVSVCLLFALWFASGAVMLYVPFPSLPSSARYDGAEAFDAAKIAVTPAQALASVPEAQALTLRARDGRVVYVASTANGKTVLDAATGEVLSPLDGAAARRIARRFSDSTIGSVDEAVEFDQWIVHEGFGADRPYHRVAIDDPDESVLYISTATGEVRQRTTHAQRFWNSVGAVPHWLYWTSIRQHWSFWDSLVWWLSLTALFSGALGMVVGVYRFVQSRVRGGSGWKVFVSWWRWHHVLGLTAGLFLLAWIFSGWLSMDHGRLFSRGYVSADETAGMAGMSLSEAAAKIQLADLQQLGAAVEVRLQAANGHPFLLVRRSSSEAAVVEPGGESHSFLPDDWLLAGVQAAFPGEKNILAVEGTPIDLYARAEELPDSARLFLLEGPSARRAYVDALSGELLSVQDPSRRAYAVVYYALHTYKFQAFVGRDTLRTTLMLLPLLAGSALSITGVVIAYRRLRRSFA